MSRLKVCGLTSPAEVAAVMRYPVSLAGLWYHCGGKRDLELSALRDFTASLTRGRVGACMVTLDADATRLADVVAETGINTLQLHGFSLPCQVARIAETVCHAAARPVEIIKVLHLNGTKCAEDRAIPAYADCGADGFILDAFSGRDRIGSTGQRVDIGAARSLVERLNPVPVMLAGGVDADLLARIDPGWGFAGFDIDGAARADDAINADRIGALFAALPVRAPELAAMEASHAV